MFSERQSESEILEKREEEKVGRRRNSTNTKKLLDYTERIKRGNTVFKQKNWIHRLSWDCFAD